MATRSSEPQRGCLPIPDHDTSAEGRSAGHVRRVRIDEGRVAEDADHGVSPEGLPRVAMARR
jgi:hypothetical protein